MMENKEKIFYPLTVVAAIVTIFLALRRAPVVITTPGGGSVTLPPLSPLVEAANAPAGYGGGTNFNYVYNALANPTDANPTDNPGVNSNTDYLRYNQPPWNDIDKIQAVYANPPVAEKTGCGCGGSSSGGGCNSRANGATFPDGAGACIGVKQKMSDAALNRVTQFATDFYGDNRKYLVDFTRVAIAQGSGIGGDF